MNKHEIQTIKQEAQRFTKGIKIIPADESAIKLELPYTNEGGEALYFFVAKRKGAKKFSLLVPVVSVGLVDLPSTLAILQPFLKTYGLLLSQEATIMEESNLPLNVRFKNMAQTVIGIDGICRLWKVQYGRQNASESKDPQPTSNSSNDSSPR